jgi:transaldolase
MSASLKSLIACGTKLWLDSIDPELVRENRAWGATGATSNPIIVSDLIKTGRFDNQLDELMATGNDDVGVAWKMTDQLVRQAQDVFLPVWRETKGNDGYVSFELDPLLEDPKSGPAHAERVKRYVAEGKEWSRGHDNRMIKIPATPAGLEAIEDLVAAGVTLNVTLIFTMRQYRAARDAAWRGAQRRKSLDRFKSVYSIFVSRVDVYSEKHVPKLSASTPGHEGAQGQLGIVNAKRIWADNQKFWQGKPLALAQEMIFASTGVKKAGDAPWKYVEAFAGSDIQTNPPATNQAVADSGRIFTRHVDELPSAQVLAEIDSLVSDEHLEKTLMEEGIQKFADPQKALIALIGEKRKSLAIT